MKYLTATVIFVVGELVGLLIFAAVKSAIGPPKTSPARKASDRSPKKNTRLKLHYRGMSGVPHV